MLINLSFFLYVIQYDSVLWKKFDKLFIVYGVYLLLSVKYDD